MGKTTKVGWVRGPAGPGATWNPWYGCTWVSHGCDECYMFREMRMYGKDPEVVFRSKTRFDAPLKWQEPHEIFTCSWGDWFHKDADSWRDEAWDIVRRTQHHTYVILTKRHGRIARHLPPDWPLPNVRLGVSAEDNDWFWRRVPVLAELPGDFVRLVSCEPLLGPIDVTGDQLRDLRVDWLITGGESGSRHRPMDLDWARGLRDACQAGGIPFFLKQLGGHPNKRQHDEAVLDGATWTEYPEEKAA